MFLVETGEGRLLTICNPHLLSDLLVVIECNSAAVNAHPNALAQLSIIQSHKTSYCYPTFQALVTSELNNLSSRTVKYQTIVQFKDSGRIQLRCYSAAIQLIIIEG